MAVITGVGLTVKGVRDAADLLDPAWDLTNGPELALDGRGMRHKDRASRLALTAADKALRDAGLRGGDAPALERAAVVVSSNLGNLNTACDFVDTIKAETVTGLSPMRVPHMSSNATACWVALEHGLRGPNITLCNGPAGGLDAMSWARNLTALGRAQVIVVIGVEPDTEPVARLHREYGCESWLDGAVGIVVESREHATARGAAALAAISGYGRADDSASAINEALGSHPRPVGLWLGADGIGTPALDLTSRLGRCSGALGVLQCAVAVQRLGEIEAVLAVAGDSDAEGDASGVSALLLTRPEHEGIHHDQG